jgi:glutamate/tyrosine decarboxylase-like PLP-dependent enzyme
VFGGATPASLAANWLAATWDQNAAFKIASPIGVKVEEVAGKWLLDLLRLPVQSAVGFVTGTTMANFSGIIAARHGILKKKGWNVEAQGLVGAPTIRIIVGEEIHASMLKALALAGLGTENLIKVPTDNQGRMIVKLSPEIDDSTLICVQAGNVNTGAIDPIKEICVQAKEKGAWVHVDAAFGMWARVSPKFADQIEGCELADSWAIDLHKWLNVPYDSGMVVCKDPNMLRAAMSMNADYLPEMVEREPYYFTPEMSRRARGIEVWAALFAMGQSGLIDLIERCCNLARLFSENLKKAGFQILNEVNLNQVLVSFGDAKLTNRIIKKIQEDGTCWCGGTIWKGQTAMRISVSSWMTTEKDIEVSSATIIRIANEEIQRESKN